MTAVESNPSRAAEHFLLKALAWSLAIHVLCFALWKTGQVEGWWRHLSMPAWMQAITKKLVQPVTIKIPQSPPKAPDAMPLIFVDTDPANAPAEPPKNAKYYSANNSLAANAEIKKPSDAPNITGRQTHVMKATDAAKTKAQPLQPSPKPADSADERAEAKPKPRQSLTPGDLAMAKPGEKTQPNEGKAETDTGAAVEPEPVHHRPRTIQEALQERGMTGEKVNQTGGVTRQRLDPGFDAMATPFGDYDREFIDAVQTRWNQLLNNHAPPSAGRVVVEFQLLPTGRVTNLKIVENTVDDLSGMICSEAISDPAPYRPWPRQMQLALGTDHRDVRFTFYYDNE